MLRVDLNSDLGESFGRYTLGMDDQILPVISSANVACGFHASDPVVMEKTVKLAKASGVAVGAHPGYPDLMGFGRRSNGAFYNMAAKDYELSRAICQAVKDFDPHLILLGLSGSQHIRAAEDVGLRAVSEVFADRAYEEDGTLVNRKKPGAMITDEDEAIRRVVRMVKEGKVTAISGRDIPIRAESICVHGDGEKALLFSKRIRAAMEAEGVAVLPMK